ncbi:MAG TPA: endonuclease [Planctomycetota bacterium]|nr:endonuclease [Planctomycetota bacterium]HRU51070.1 endonuclease [Planctomycetota bacterium]
MSKLLSILCFIFCISLMAGNLPESLHPYENDAKVLQHYSSNISDVTALEVTFSQETEVEEDVDYIILLNSNGDEVAKYTGTQLAGLTVRIEGNSFSILLKADDTKNAYGYKVESIRAIYEDFESYSSINDVDYDSISHLTNDDLKSELYNMVKGHTSIGYDSAKVKMFSYINNKNGTVRCVYTGIIVQITGIPANEVMNTEHTWPKSLGASSEPAKSDLHHLFPTDSVTNSRRSNYPFGTVTNQTWSKGGSVLGTNSSQGTCFQPREDHRGNVARAMFYFAIRYQKSLDANQERTLRQWNREDPVDQEEMTRNDLVAQFQKKRNPFIDHPEYVDQINDF